MRPRRRGAFRELGALGLIGAISTPLATCSRDGPTGAEGAPATTAHAVASSKGKVTSPDVAYVERTGSSGAWDAGVTSVTSVTSVTGVTGVTGVADDAAEGVSSEARGISWGAGAAGNSGASEVVHALGGARTEVPKATRYLASARHSPMTAEVIARMRQVMAAGGGRHDVFAKIGDSITVNGFFLYGFGSPDVKLDRYDALAPTVAFFNETRATGRDSSFKRVSLAAKIGWGVGATLAGNPSPIEQEIAAISPSFAVVMLGTNNTYPTGLNAFDRDLLRVVDLLLAKGVVPLLSTIPPRWQSEANALVPEMNAIIRAIAQMRHVPLMDYWQTLIDLPGYGLSGDGVHPAAFSAGGVGRGCWLTPAALHQGVNQRNLITLEALDRARRFLVPDALHASAALDAPSALDPSAAPETHDGVDWAESSPPALVGAGTWTDPVMVDALPFVDDGDTRETARGADSASTYGCGPRAEEKEQGGREVVYRVEITRRARLSLRVLGERAGEVDLDLHWLSAADPSSCIARADSQITVTASPGTYYLAVDTRAVRGVAKAGVYRVTIVEK